jgi:hypothetical protein
MWTPRRIILALVGLLAFAAGFFGYEHFLGTLDGLPPLPDRFSPQPTLDTPRDPIPIKSRLNRKLELAFGPGCPEIDYPIKTELKGRRTLVATHEFHIIKENDPRDGHRAGWVKLIRLSLATFSEKLGPEGIPEINTLYADVAYLKFDKPIRGVADFNDSKIVTAEILADQEAQFSDPRKGRIRAQNNRRTLDLNDDIEMVTPGPVYYEDQPKKGQPHIYTFATVHVTDHLNTGLPEPNRFDPRAPTVAGDGMRVYLTPEDERKTKEKEQAKKEQAKLPIPHKDPTPGVTGVELIELDHAVTMKLWTDADASFVAPGGGEKDSKKEAKKAAAKKDKDAKPVEKRLLTIETNGPFRYDLNKELAHFEKPAVPSPGLIEQVVVTRQGRAVGLDTLTCEYMDVQFQRKKPVPPKKDGELVEEPPPPPKKKDGDAGDGDLEIKSIKAWGETVVMTSDSENLHATCTELTHDAEAHVTALKGDANQPVQAVKDGNLIRGSEIYLFGDGKEISQAHVLGAGSVGLGELDPKTGEFFKTATFSDRLLYTREPSGEKDARPIDVLTFVGKDGVRCSFRDTSGEGPQDIKGDLLKVWLKPAESEEANKKKDPAKKPEPKRLEPKKDLAKKDPTKKDATNGARPTRVEARGHVESTSPDLVIQHTNYLEVDIREVEELIKPPEPEPKGKDGKPLPPKKGPAGPKGEMPAPRVVDPKAGPVVKGPEQPKPLPGAVTKDGEAKAEEPEEKKPIVVTAQTIHAWANRDPQGRNELDHVLASGDARAHQDPTNKDDLGTDIVGKTIFMQTYKDGNRLLVTGTPGETPAAHQWGVVRSDKLTMFGFDIAIDQRDNTSRVKGEGSMEIISGTDMEGKKLEKPTTMHIYWKHKMDFYGAEKLIYYHGGVQGYQEGSRLKCEWMQVLLDRPVLLNQDMKAKQTANKKKPGDKKDENPNIDTVMCFYAPKDEDVPKPRRDTPVVAIQEEKEGDKVVKFQSIQAPDLVNVRTKLDPDPMTKDAAPRYRTDMTATSSETMPGTVRIWQPGQRDALADKPEEKKEPGKKEFKDPKAKAPPPKKKGELDEDQEMQLTVVQFGGKMIANDFRKRAKFYNNIRCVHLPADSPTVPVDLREGEIPKGAVYLECRDSLDVFSTEQMEKNKKTGKMEPVSYQEMIAVGNVRVNKQGEFFGDADRVTYSELKGTMTFHGTEKNPARVNKLEGQGLKPKTLEGKTIVYYVKTKTFEVTEATRFNQ